MRACLVAGNWKMHGSQSFTQELLQQLIANLSVVPTHVECLVCPPFVYLDQAQSLIKNSNIILGAQNVASSDKGAFTGEISPAMLREFGCSYVIIGHSERRSLLGETDALIAAKFQLLIDADLWPILCVDDRAEQQLTAVIDKVGVHGFSNAVIAYEPVWAIGTGVSATPQQAQAMHLAIRGVLAAHDAVLSERVRIIYGGSVNSSNAAALFGCPDIDGSLVGGAALKAQDFSDICRVAVGIKK